MNLIGTSSQLIRGCTAPTGSNPNFYGMNILPAWYDFLTTQVGGFYWQIDLAHSAGCNVVRAMSDGGGSCWKFVFDPSGTFASNQAIYLSRVIQVANYAASRGMWFYPTLNCCTYNGYSTFTDIASFAAAFCHAMSGLPNVIGVDIAQEFYLMNSLGTTCINNGGSPASCVDSSSIISSISTVYSLVTQILAACRAAAPNLALTASYNRSNSNSGMWGNTDVGNTASGFDYLDYHCYYNPSSGDSASVYGQSGTSGKPFLVGEHGDNMSDGQAAQVSRATNVQANVVDASYSGQPGCRGSLWWACQPQDTPNGGDDWGAWDASGNPRSVVAAIAAQPAITPVIQFTSARRRRAS